MLIRISSDLHIEFWKQKDIEKILIDVIPELETDMITTLVLAGDIGLYNINLEIVLRILSDRFDSIIWVSGNHFFYNEYIFHNFETHINQNFLPLNVTLLEDSYELINDVLFIGANLWTDFNKSNPIDMLEGKFGINDFRIIRKSDRSVITPEDTIETHKKSKRFIFDALEKYQDDVRKTIVVTHHGVSRLSVDNIHKDSKLNSSFISDLDQEIIDLGPDIWIHGHSHNSSDYMLGSTQVICNPYGYKDQEENLKYNRKLVLEV